MADDALIVQFQIVDMAQATTQLNAFANKLNALPAQITTGASKVSAASARMFSPAVDQTQKIVRNLNAAAGPMQKLQAAQLNMRRAIMTGDPSQAFDAQHRLKSAQSAVVRAQNKIQTGTPGGKGPALPPSFGQAMKNAIFSTRFTANNGHLHLMPLVGRSMQALAALGPVGVAAGAAAVTIGVLAAAAGHAAGVINEFTAAKFAAGGTAEETGKGMGMGKLFGFDAAQAALNLADKISVGGDPFARMMAMKAGIQDNFGNNPLFGSLDKMANFNKATQAVVMGKDDEQAQRLAKGLGPDFVKMLELRLLPEGERAQVMDKMKAMFSTDAQVAAVRHKVAMQEVSASFDRLQIALVPLVKIFSSLLELVNGLLSGDVDKNANAFAGNMDRTGAKKKSADKMKSSMDANTAAIDQNTSTLKGVFGGGMRGRNAYPGGIGGAFAMDPGVRNAIRAGALL